MCAEKIRPLRILYIQGPPGGGSTLSLYDLARGLDRKRFESVTLFLEENDYRRDFEKSGIQVVRLNYETKRFRPKTILHKAQHILGTNLLLAMQIARIIRDNQIDLVHQNTGMNVAAMMACYLTRTPQVAHYRTFKGRVAHTAKWLSRNVNAFIYITRSIAEHYTSLGLPSERASVIYDPIDVETFCPTNNVAAVRKTFGVSDNGKLVSNVGRITPWKGQDVFLRAIAEVVKSIPDIKVLIVGKASSSEQDQMFYNRLQRLVVDHGMSRNVVFTGLRSDVPSIMAASDVVVHSAVEPEPFGRVIPEAMAAGTAVIATAAGGVVEIVTDQLDGLLVPPRNVSSMAVAIRSLLEDPAKAVRLGEKGRTTVIERFSCERHIEEIQNLYARISNH